MPSSLMELPRLYTVPPLTTSDFGSITFPSLCSGSPPRRVHSSSSMSPLLTTFRVCGLLRAEFEKALLVTTSRSCIRRAVLMRPSAARACSSSSCRRLLKSSRPSLEALGAADGGFTWAARPALLLLAVVRMSNDTDHYCGGLVTHALRAAVVVANAQKHP